MRKLQLRTMVLALFLYLPGLLPGQGLDEKDVEGQVSRLGERITAEPDNANLYVQRADLFFLMHDFERANEDYTKAIELDDKLDKAYFGRGLTLGRQGFIRDGIRDLSRFLQRNPTSSIGYTKRGVRYLWLGERDKARVDLEKAIALDSRNAEAHDDLGVVYAQGGDYARAISHFKQAVSIDATYQKGFHNLAMAYYLSENDALALSAVDVALHLRPNSRNSLLLKSQILSAVGRTEEAEQIKEFAEFLPEENWHETAPVN